MNFLGASGILNSLLLHPKGSLKQFVTRIVIYLKFNEDSVQDVIFVTVAFSDGKTSSAHKMSQYNHKLNKDASDICPSPKTISIQV